MNSPMLHCIPKMIVGQKLALNDNNHPNTIVVYCLKNIIQRDDCHQKIEDGHFAKAVVMSRGLLSFSYGNHLDITSIFAPWFPFSKEILLLSWQNVLHNCHLKAILTIKDDYLIGQHSTIFVKDQCLLTKIVLCCPKIGIWRDDHWQNRHCANRFIMPLWLSLDSDNNHLGMITAFAQCVSLDYCALSKEMIVVGRHLSCQDDCGCCLKTILGTLINNPLGTPMIMK